MALIYSPSWNNQYECNVLPVNSTPVWTTGGGGTGTLDKENVTDIQGQLHLKTTLYARNYTINNLFSNLKVSTAEIKAKVLSFSAGGYPLFLALNNSTKYGFVRIFPNKLQLLYSDSTGTPALYYDYMIDMTSFHKIKIRLNATNSVDYFVDGNLVFSSNYVYNTTLNTVSFGTASDNPTQESYIDYVYYCTDGFPILTGYLIQDKNNNLYTYETELTKLNIDTLTDSLFLNKGISDPTVINNLTPNTKGVYMKDEGTLGTGKLFSVNLESIFKNINSIK